MVIIDKMELPPPPPYLAADSLNLPPFPHRREGNALRLDVLPPNLLLRIVYEVFPRGQPEGQRKTLYWLSTSLRLVNRALYVACMHVLRSTYLPAYNHLVHAPYTSDPFPLSTPDRGGGNEQVSPVHSLQRETRVLDLFISLKVREDVWTDDSELHLEREESFKDLFDMMQPRSRLEDLVRIYGVREGVMSVAKPSSSTFRSTTSGGIPFGLLSVAFSPRKAGLVLTTKQRKKAIVEVARRREDTLERSAKQLVKELHAWLSVNSWSAFP
ncbi:hypothetical protein WOLCODRAFT_121242 [Wolfiporia cocos MD-104 SS10]|uniref:Uncharacterized protein n=1 Tax=Wolfiporia cocos (strain MD-104) TaxID=742152 RepID=A0A2H3JN75_WOLCO|nr:hypothetical protein WOLCODRAFT_121242 [Wolfiporia cocos MD-104 SS10]